MADQPHHRAAFPPAPPLVGRERERATLREALDAALVGHGSLVLIGGEAGIGKTALAECLVAEVTAQGVRVLVGRCYDLSDTPPYGPWVELFGRYTPTEGLPPSPIFGRPGVLGAASGPAELREQCVSFFCALATVRPDVLLLDDLHWADPCPGRLLHPSSNPGTPAPGLVVNPRGWSKRPGQVCGRVSCHHPTSTRARARVGLTCARAW